MAITFNITEKVMDAMIGYLEDNVDIAAAEIPVRRWMDISKDTVYPSIMVNATGYNNPDFGKNILLGNNVLVNIGIFTETVKDTTGSVIEGVIAFVRESIVQDDIEIKLNAENAGLFVYTNGVIITNNSVGTDDNKIRQRNINLEIACTIKDDGT